MSAHESVRDASSPEPSGWKKVRTVVKVVELRLRFIVLMAATGLGFAYWDTLANLYGKWSRPAHEHVAAASETEYFCPMHPSVVRDQTANCPMCGMPLSKRKKGQKEELPEGVTARIQLAPLRIRQAGIRTTQVAFEPLAETIATVGTVAFDERRLSRISSKIKGSARVEALYVDFTGSTVREGEPLAELYSPELYQAVRELLVAQRSQAERPAVHTPLGASLRNQPEDLVGLAREKLGLWGIAPQQVDAILTSRQVESRLPILSPIQGVVVRKNVVKGQYVSEGDSLFEIADLSHVWVLAQVHEDQVGRIRVGQDVEASLTAFPGETFRGKVAFIDPALDPATRTVAVRYDLSNPDGRLRPGMYANVTLRVPLADTPMFRSRLAKRAAAPAGPVPAVSLTPAEQKTCPVTHEPLVGMGEPIAVQVADRRVWVCCAGCPPELEKHPEKYLAIRETQPEPTIAEQGICPVTGKKLGSMGNPILAEAKGRKVWLCCAGCTPKLQAEPEKYLARLQPAPGDGVPSVPESAVIDTGKRKVVYVETEPGIFEGRLVVLGPRVGDRYPVLEGLQPGENVVTVGAFLIDAESRLNPATAPATTAPPKSPAPAHDHGHRS